MTEPGGKWMPIDTAPKDGTEVLLWVPGLGARPAEYYEGDFRSPIDFNEIYDDATHWMPALDGPGAS